MIHRPDRDTSAWVVFCHGFGTSRMGGSGSPFVTLARSLAKEGIASFRFDLPGHGESEGDFSHTMFDDWIAAVEVACEQVNRAGAHRIGLVGMSMGGACVFAVSARRYGDCVVGWNADFKIRGITHPPGSRLVGDYWDEKGKRIHKAFWEQVEHSGTIETLRETKCSGLLLYTSDEPFTPEEDRMLIGKAGDSNITVEIVGPGGHGIYNMNTRQRLQGRSLTFLKNHLLE